MCVVLCGYITPLWIENISVAMGQYDIGQCFSNLFGLLPSFQLEKFSAPLPLPKNLSLPSTHIVVIKLLN